MKSTTKFIISDSFVLTNRNLFVLIGRIDNGDIKPGMTLLSVTNILSLQVDSIEDVRSSIGKGVIGVVFKLKSENELVFLNEISKQEYVLFE